MEKSIAGKRLREYNRLFWENDELYREALRDLGLPEGAFWILYALRADGEGGQRMTQSEMGRILHLPKQTLNSALKKLENDGILALAAGPDRRSKHVLLTQKGATLAEQTADRLITVENDTFSHLTEQEQDALLGLLEKFNALFRKNAANLKGESAK